MGFSREGTADRHGRLRVLQSAAIALLTVAMPLPVSSAWAAMCMVSDDASLNAAIVNASCGTITLANSITLNSNLPVITRDLTIDGGSFTIDGAGAFQALQISSGTVAIDNLTVNGARAQGGTGGGAGQGGAIFVGAAAALTMSNVTLSNNEAVGGLGSTGGAGGSASGGALFVQSGATVIANGVLTITANTAVGGAGNSSGSGGQGSGGGIGVQSGATFTLSNGSTLVLANNTAKGGASGSGGGTGGSASGGGIDNEGILIISNSQIANNSALGGIGTNTGGSAFGGGVDNQGSLTLGNSTITSNGALGGTGNLIGGNASGGGVYTLSGNNIIALNTLTIQSNAATGGTGNVIGGNAGAGVFINSGNLTLSPVAGVTQTIADGIAGNGSLTKAGPGNLIASAANTYSGTTTVNDGVLIAGNNGALGGGVVTVNAPGVLNLGTTKQVVPGLDLGGALADTLAGTGVGQYGKLNATGTATIAGELDLSLAGGFELAVGDQFDIMGFNVLSGDFTAVTFDGLACTWTPSGSGGIADCPGGLDLSLTELSGDNPDPFFQLNVLNVPEPGALMLLGSGLGVLLILPWRESRRVRPRRWL